MHASESRFTFTRHLTLVAVVGICLQSQPVEAGPVGDFAADVAKKVAVDVLASVIKDAVKPGGQSRPQVVAGTSDDKTRVQNIVLALISEELPLDERIGLYATRVDYFGAGIVGHDFILKDRQRFEKRWPTRKYSLRSVDEIEVAADRAYAMARYTIEYKVNRDLESRSGVSQVALVIGSFNVQPRIHAIKEWVVRSE